MVAFGSFSFLPFDWQGRQVRGGLLYISEFRLPWTFFRTRPEPSIDIRNDGYPLHFGIESEPIYYELLV